MSALSNSKAGGGAWEAQLLEHPTLAQVMILRLMSSSPTLGSVLTAQSPPSGRRFTYLRIAGRPCGWCEGRDIVIGDGCRENARTLGPLAIEGLWIAL